MHKEGYDHGEAFCVMEYQCEGCGKKESLWNSRDGVTPFVVGCTDCKGEMRHCNWGGDRCDPDYVPKPGQRVFIDLAKEVNEIYCKIRVDRFWDHPNHLMREMFKNKSEAVDKLSEDMHEGEPFIITI